LIPGQRAFGCEAVVIIPAMLYSPY